MSPSAPGVAAQWPREGLERVGRCPACGAAERSVLHSGLTDRTYLAAPGVWQLFRCGACGAAYLDPRPDARTLPLAFTSFYDADAPARDPGEAAGGRRPLRRALRNGYLEARYGYELSPRSRLGRYFVPLAPRHREAADELVRHLPRPQGPARLLDIGCGEGDFLETMSRLGWDAEGIEPSPEAVRVARRRGVTVTHGSLAESPLAAQSFDAVTFQLVLEYLRDPESGLRTCWAALKTGGVLWIASPSLESTAYRVFGPDWIFLETPRHAVVFTLESLVSLVSRIGFEVVSVHPSRRAAWSFRLSNAIRQGLPPFRQPPRLPRRLALHARLADLEALRRPERADVFVLRARKR